MDKKSFYIDGVYFEPFISVRRNDFYNIFLNIISNAVHHGFKNKRQTNTNLVRISSHFDFKDYNCVIKIANNGVPFPQGFGQKELITFGEKTFTSKGNGIGGYDINKLVKENNGSFKILSNPEAEFPVAYILKFPLSEEFLEEELSNNKNKG
ncbi:MAG: ATP-binding protein [bacterium]